MVALGIDAREETLLDCIDLMEILSSPDYEQTLCWQDGALNYMLPANRDAYPPLIAQDPLYTQLLEVAASPNNVAFRAGAAYYEQMEQLNDTLLKRMRGNQ